MKYKNKQTGAIITAYRIDQVLYNGQNHSIGLPEVKKLIGLFPEQTGSYVPEPGDFYIDAGKIEDSSVVAVVDFLADNAAAD